MCPTKSWRLLVKVYGPGMICFIIRFIARKVTDKSANQLLLATVNNDS